MEYSYDRRTARIELGGSIEPLYGHDSERTAYVVDDYPYGFRLRTQIRYWLDHKGSNGWRLVSQTLNPKTGRWNKPKASTYSRWAGAMYLDSQNHVKWAGLTEYSDVDDFIQFARAFPRADFSIVKRIVPKKVTLLTRLLEGTAHFTVNDVKQEPSDAEQKARAEELEKWRKLTTLL